ncbi:hypothetical protein [Streptomyces decoyicus]|uniref:hypothetical protein n=1 Tax=Streptomyces decoyicus TaxID=249567 RepID=UPI00365A9D9E
MGFWPSFRRCPRGARAPPCVLCCATSSHPPETRAHRRGHTEQRRTLIPAIVELPLAQHILPSGLAPTVYKRFNQVRKALATAYYLHISHHGALTGTDIEALTSHQMGVAARSAGVEAPNSIETRELVRAVLRVFNRVEASATPVAETPVSRDELARAISGLAVVVQAASQGVNR